MDPAPAFASAADFGVDVEKLALWRKKGGGVLEPALTSGAVALLDALWIIEQAEAGGVLKHRQELPGEAFLSLADLVETTSKNGLPIVALSYPWLAKEHPDLHGDTLGRVAKALRALLSDPDIFSRLGVFWDFGSLHQHPDPATGVVRTEAEDVLFKQGLGCLGTLYSHPNTTVLRLTSLPACHMAEAEYMRRGWCFTENSWATLTKSSGKSLDLGLMRDGEEYDSDSLIRACVQHGGRRPPLLPRAFAAALEGKRFTNGKDDRPLVEWLYHGAFEQRFAQATALHYGRLDWGDAEAAQVADVLASGAAPRLEMLDLCGNQIRDEGCRALAAALKQGAAPSLKELCLERKPPELVAVCEARGIRLNSTARHAPMGRENCAELGGCLEFLATLNWYDMA